MSKPTLFLLQPGFDDEKQPGKTFFCPAGTFIEGVLAVYPQLKDQIEVRRVPFPRPRQAVIAAAGEANQSLPLLVLDGQSDSSQVTGEHEGHSLVAGKEAIAAYFAETYGIDWSH
ncbi:DUF3088 domain-containing protein [Corticibacter populi]|uniref:DUF3088 domain-containing protein n=1 Tax=Corticibacter populi TaxID=1550736 RepID=A0A3M6R1P4_9BURK|nr:DUF3088 domain-containing protein [Corticibacter populi]RMX08682.1 DUF3088 domain-containing protein [Corticibacter populi]RZS36024.1 DUF3088 family protein [Corticibacter populi]